MEDASAKLGLLSPPAGAVSLEEDGMGHQFRRA